MSEQHKSKFGTRELIILVLIISFLLVPFLANATNVKLKNPLTGADIVDIDRAYVQTTIGKAASIIVGSVGAFALAMFIYGGVTLLTSAGNPERLGQGKQIIIWATIGILAIMGSYAVLNLIITYLSGQG